MADENYELSLPDGSVQKGKLDASGVARAAAIDPGLGTISWFLKPSKPKNTKGKGVVEAYDKPPMPAPPVWPPSGLPPLPPKVAAIKVTVPRTIGKRDKTKSRGSDTSWIATSSDPSMTANPPKVVVCGTKELLLEAVTVPLNQPVTWKVDPNPAVGTKAPSLVPQGGSKAILKTDKHGSFSVTATLSGAKIVWNVAFVRVKVDVGSTLVHHRKDGYEDSGSDGAHTVFQSGTFVTGEYAWDATVDAEVIGGGDKEDLGVGKVKLHILQNGVACNLTGGYEPKDGLPGTALEVPKGGFPVLDSSDGASPFVVASTCFSVKPTNSGRKRKVFTGDSPQGAFPNSHEHTSKALKTITGGQTFKAAIASTSDDVPGSIVVHAQIYWIANYPGLVHYAGNVGKYHPMGAATTILNAFPGESEKDPSGRIRHVWSMSGVTRDKDGTVKGHLRAALEKACEKGFLPKLP